jgi:hypothetical protein
MGTRADPDAKLVARAAVVVVSEALVLAGAAVEPLPRVPARLRVAEVLRTPSDEGAPSHQTRQIEAFVLPEHARDRRALVQPQAVRRERRHAAVGEGTEIPEEGFRRLMRQAIDEIDVQDEARADQEVDRRQRLSRAVPAMHGPEHIAIEALDAHAHPCDAAPLQHFDVGGRDGLGAKPQQCARGAREAACARKCRRATHRAGPAEARSACRPP